MPFQFGEFAPAPENEALTVPRSLGTVSAMSIEPVLSAIDVLQFI